MLRVSRASVREALRALEMMGFVEIRSGGLIKETSAEGIIQPLAMCISIEKGAFFEIYEIRKSFETAAAT